MNVSNSISGGFSGVDIIKKSINVQANQVLKIIDDSQKQMQQINQISKPQTLTSSGKGMMLNIKG